MASLLLRRRLSPVVGISRTLLQDYIEPYRIPWEFKAGTSTDICDCSRPFCSSSGVSKFDFTDLTRPHTWYPSARKKNRNVILHVGPTNSGKTHHALKQLESSSSGIYCGPLRLLAWEVAKRLNNAKVPCSLITGQEREEVDGAKHKAVTVEMADVTSDYDCAVIDEIQNMYKYTKCLDYLRNFWGGSLLFTSTAKNYNENPSNGIENKIRDDQTSSAGIAVEGVGESQSVQGESRQGQRQGAGTPINK